METEMLLSCSQDNPLDPTLSQLNPIYTLTLYTSGLFPLGFPTKILYALLP